MKIIPFRSAQRPRNQCACCGGKFGLVRHRKEFKQFCSQRCVDGYHRRVFAIADDEPIADELRPAGAQ
jgi:hypothetical protein